MTERYFEKFPLIQYSNNTVVDITRRAVLLNRVSQNPYAFYDYDISDEERADQFANRYFEDPYQAWILYITNKIVDPYYEWYMSEKEFTEFVVKKYGDLYLSQRKIKYYVNDYTNSEEITVGGYNALTPCMKKYWEPIYGVGSNIVSYQRKKIEWTHSTNKIISYGVSNTSFIKDEIVDIVFDANNTGKGQVLAGKNNNVYLQHVYGTYYVSNTATITGNSYIYGTESGVNTVFTSTAALANNIPEDEFVYWKPVTYYEYEYDKNEYNKSIRVLDKDYAQQISDNLKQLMSE